ncbi:MAG: SH3 domain-containing protein [Pseudomonadota bacterium]|nr:SH3 domain-containing protein [Pseudomonadota bacterium]
MINLILFNKWAKFCRGLCTFATLIAFFTVHIAYSETSRDSNGEVTGLPIPRFVSTKSDRINVRIGPGREYSINWVYRRKGLPLKVTAEYGNWRKVEDFEGEGGWVHSRLISGNRFIIFLSEASNLKRKANVKSPNLAVIERGVVAKLLNESPNWCKVSVDGYKGWVQKNRVWGLEEKDY